MPALESVPEDRVRDWLYSALLLERTGDVERGDRSVSFRRSAFAPLSRVSVLDAIEHGELRVVPRASQLVVEYDLSFRLVPLVGLAVALVVPVALALTSARSSVDPVYAYLAGGAWIGALPVVWTWLRFPPFLESSLRALVASVADRALEEETLAREPRSSPYPIHDDVRKTEYLQVAPLDALVIRTENLQPRFRAPFAHPSSASTRFHFEIVLVSLERDHSLGCWVDGLRPLSVD